MHVRKHVRTFKKYIKNTNDKNTNINNKISLTNTAFPDLEHVTFVALQKT